MLLFIQPKNKEETDQCNVNLHIWKISRLLGAVSLNTGILNTSRHAVGMQSVVSETRQLDRGFLFSSFFLTLILRLSRTGTV